MPANVAGTQVNAGFDGLIGLVLREVSADLVTANVAVHDQLRDRTGAVHGGVLAAVAETAAVSGAGVGLDSARHVAVALSNLITLVHPITGGTIHARAIVRHSGRTTRVWEVEVTDDSGRLCAFARVTVNIRPV